LEDVVAKYSEFKELEKPLTYIKNGFGCWYTCMLYPVWEPTNNLGEQAMREHVIIRKIIGCFPFGKWSCKLSVMGVRLSNPCIHQPLSIFVGIISLTYKDIK